MVSISRWFLAAITCGGCYDLQLRGLFMSGHGPSTRPKVPEGKTSYLTTRQKAITEGAFFVGYDTIWESFQKEVEYKTPKKP